MRGPSRTPSLLVAFAVFFVGLAPGGCQQAVSYPSLPPTRLIPTSAGVIETWSVYGNGWLYTLTDGRTVTAQHEPDVQLLGSGPNPGDLVLVSTTPPKFNLELHPLLRGGPNCWDPWSQTDSAIAWDMGQTVLFAYGLQLPKAPNYVNEVDQRVIDGRTVWEWSNGESGINVCVNSSGQIESVKLLDARPT